jgi:diadenosine tetraphosphate (Ap4A) HIT family hydrolase
LIAELRTSWLTMADDANAPALPGTCALFHKRHAVHLHDLALEEGAAFMHDVQTVSAALFQASGAAKMNYEIHGNTIPHLHLHLFPRYRGDAFESRPIDPRVSGTETDRQGHRRIRQALIKAFAGPRPAGHDLANAG